jgi:serine/threonine protein kinase
MALTPQTRLGPYEIVALLGAGGMGEVYRATDTNLGRPVAIKVLPEAFAQDADRLARFEREARTLASLSHPNIAIVHGLERSSGAFALVMELVEGPTLADRIAQGSIAVAGALAIARQIAEALEAAHEQGIVHRDLKPANVKVKADGTVKVLDFGLAKALAPEPDAATPRGLSLSPTITSPAMTQVGVIMGTAAYMSPEQARGLAADRRSDVWAFGCIVYEMLTGRSVFDGQTVSDVLAGVLRADPDWQLLPPGLHPRLRLMLERCMSREMRNRYQGISDARVDIEAVLKDPAGNVQTAESAGRPDARRRVWPAIAMSGVVGAIAAALAMLFLYPVSERDVAAIQFNLTPPDGAMFDSSSGGIPFAVSPDGDAIAFAARAPGEPSRLWLQPFDSERARPLHGTEDATAPFWSADGDWLAFYAHGSLKKVRRTGGEPQTITSTISDGEGGSAWSIANTILFKSGRFEAPWMVVSAQGGAVSQATRFATGEDTHVWPTFLADGKHFVHQVWGEADHNGFYLASLDGGQPRLLKSISPSERGVAHVPGYLLFVRDGALIARRFDEKQLDLGSEEFRVVDGITACCGGWDPWSVSQTGVVAIWRNNFGYDTVLRWYARDGTFTEAVGAPSRYYGFALSPDGRRIAFSRFVAGGSRDIWVRDTARDTETRLTFDGDAFGPVWSQTGNEIAFSSSRGKVPDVYVTNATGGTSDQARRVSALTSAVDVPASWTRDGSDIVYTASTPDGRTEMRSLHLADQTEKRLPPSGPFTLGTPRLSPDGKWMAYVTDASGRPEVWLAQYPSGDARTQVSRNGGVLPEWKRDDGRELYYVSIDQRLMAVSVETTISGVTVGLAQQIMQLPDMVPITGWVDRQSYTPSADGRRFLVETLAPGVRQPPLHVIVNWPALLKK